MTRTSIAALLALTLAAALPDRVSSQSPTGTISGVVTDPDGAVFKGAFVQARGAKEYNEASDDGGKYTLQVAPGTYDLSISVPGMKSFSRKGIVVQANQIVTIYARLEDTASLRTLGEDPASIAARFFTRPEPPKGRTPRLSTGKPDLSGMWLSGPADLDTLPMLPWAASLAKERSDAHMKDFPPTYCLPSGPVPLLDPGHFKLVHHPATLLMLFEGDTPGFRQVFLDGRPHPKNADPLWLGHSIGRWEKDTLVIESIGFRDRGWLDFEGRPHTDKLRVTQRLSRPDLGHLNIEVTIDDPGALEKPWKTTKGAQLDPGEEILESICTENNKAPGLISGSK
jgi:hypothetical protein